MTRGKTRKLRLPDCLKNAYCLYSRKQGEPLCHGKVESAAGAASD